MNNKRQTSRGRPSRHRGRMKFMQGTLVVFLGLVAIRMPYVRDAFGVKLEKDANAVQTVSGVLLAPRGALLDTNGHRLAYDVPAFWLDIKSSAFQDKQRLAELLAPALGVSVEKLTADLGSAQGWKHWPLPIFEPSKEQILAKLSDVKDDQGNSAKQDVTFTPTEKRFYPYGTFAANTIGYINQDRKGQLGLELEYDKILSGQNGTYSYTKDGYGFPISSTMKVTQKPVPGLDVQLTLDQTIQGFVEAKMDELVGKYHPDHAAIIVMNPKTGAVLGMASRPTFDPNQYWKSNYAAMNNWAVNSSFEPGSTFKVAVLAAGLATHVISMNDSLYDPGYLYVKNRRIKDWKYGGFGQINFEQALEVSSNVAFATVAEKLGWDRLIEYMGKFGYLKPTGIDLPAEANSLIFAPQNRGPVELATTGFGQGIAVTPMQQMAAVAAIANGGKLMRPYLAKAFIDPTTGKVVKRVEPKVVDPQVVPPDVARQVNDAMIKDISVGIDYTGYVSGYDVGGKTGTAQIADSKGQYYSDRFITSFIGYAPGWDPQVEVYVTLYWPKTQADQQWGSTIATPAARDILQECMQYYHIAPRADAVVPSLEPKTSVKETVQKPAKYTETPSLVGVASKDVVAIAKKYGINIQVIGGEGIIKNQWPQAGIEVAEGTTLYAYVPEDGSHSVTMPNLVGVSMREAGDILAAMGLKVVAKGTGFVNAQSVSPGEAVPPGTQVIISCSPPTSATPKSSTSP